MKYLKWAVFSVVSVFFLFQETAVHAATVKNFLDLCRNGTLTEVRTAIRKGTDLEMRRFNGFTPLMESIFNKNPEVLLELIKSGANVDARDNAGATTLINLAYFGKDPFDASIQMKALVDAGADVNIQTLEGQTVLMVLVMPSLRYPDPVDIIDFLLDAGADLSLEDGKGRTAWDYAFENRKFENSNILIKLKPSN